MWSKCRAGVGLVLVLVAMIISVPPAAAAPSVRPAVQADVVPGSVIPGLWTRPVGGPVVRGFEPPSSPFGPGHLGVDFAVAPGTAVHAAGPGVVVFAGSIGSERFVVVRHSGDIRTTDSFLASITVVVGQTVSGGQVLGTTGGTGPGHDAGVLHFGVRIGAVAIDPMRLFAPPDLAAVVHLAAPHGGPTGTGGSDADSGGGGALGERAALVADLQVGARVASGPPAWWNAPPDASGPFGPPAPRYRRW